MAHSTGDDGIRVMDERRELPPLPKFALEMGPLLVFFFANARGERLAELFPTLAALGGPIFVATALFMTATAVSLVISYALTRTVPLLPLLTGAVVLAFGALTIWLQDELFIKIKPTIINGGIGAVLLVGLALGRPLLRPVFGAAFDLDDEGWRKLTLRWGLFFLALALLNEAIWRTQTTDFWVAFKVWGMFPITLAFTLSQMPLIMRHSRGADGPAGEGG